MHPTRDTPPVIKLGRASGRVMRGVMCLSNYEVGVMRREAIALMSPEELELLTTKQLLARLERLRRCEESARLSDVGEAARSPGVLFKDTPEWAAAYEQLKGVLARREHVPTGLELAERRKSRAKLSRTTGRIAGRQRRD
jgi:hypothetical protein